MKYQGQDLNKMYFQGMELKKLCFQGTVVYVYEEPGGGETYAIFNTLSEAQGLLPDTHFDWVWAKTENKWFRYNNIGRYEEYGVYSYSIDESVSAYKGKLAIDAGKEYEWNGIQWMNKGDCVQSYDCLFSGNSAYFNSNQATLGKQLRMTIDFTTSDKSSGTYMVAGTRKTYQVEGFAITTCYGDNPRRLRADIGNKMIYMASISSNTSYKASIAYVGNGTINWSVYNSDGGLISAGTETGVSFSGVNYPVYIGANNQGGSLHNDTTFYGKINEVVFDELVDGEWETIKDFIVKNIDDQPVMYDKINNVSVNNGKPGTASVVVNESKTSVPVEYETKDAPPQIRTYDTIEEFLADTEKFGNCIIIINSTNQLLYYKYDGTYFSLDDNMTIQYSTIDGNTVIPKVLSGYGGNYVTSVYQDSGKTIFDGNVTTIPASAYSATTITFMKLPASVMNIYYNSLLYCPNLTALTIDTGNTRYYSDNNCIINKSSKGLLFGVKSCTAIPDGVSTIGNNAFTTVGITSMSFPNTVKAIGENAFGNAKSLTGISLNEGILTIGAQAFITCTNLKTVSIPATVTYMGNNVFSGCTALSSITFNSQMKTSNTNPLSNTSNVTKYSGYQCYSKVTELFMRLNKIQNVSLQNITNANDIQLWYCAPNLTDASVKNVVNNLATNTGDTLSICLGDKLTAVTDSEIAAAAEKNWTVTDYKKIKCVDYLGAYSAFTPTSAMTAITDSMFDLEGIVTMTIRPADAGSFYGVAPYFHYVGTIQEMDITLPSTMRVLTYPINSGTNTTLRKLTLRNCGILTKIRAFLTASNLEKLWLDDISKASYSSVGPLNTSCTALTDVYVEQLKNTSQSWNAPNLTVVSLLNIFNALPTTTSAKLTIGAGNLAKLSDEQIAIATSKGWTLA